MDHSLSLSFSFPIPSGSLNSSVGETDVRRELSERLTTAQLLSEQHGSLGPGELISGFFGMGEILMCSNVEKHLCHHNLYG
jgi:hypothetical protein